MADIYLEVEDYLWFEEYQQGNVNVAGLVFDDLIEESLDLGQEAYVVWTDQIEETIDFSEGFTPTHWPEISETIDFCELFGTAPTRVRQSVLNVIYTKPTMPIRIGHMHMDVLLGSDTFIEEVSSELQIHSTYANAVPYWWETIYESLDIDMTEPQPRPPYTITRKFLVTDLVNMRHAVVQDYEFNSQCHEALFIWDKYAWGWSKLLAEFLTGEDSIQEIIGKLADEYIHLGDWNVPKSYVLHILNETVFIFDEGAQSEYEYIMMDEWGIHLGVSDGLDVGDEPKDDYGTRVVEDLGISETVNKSLIFPKLATESLLFSDALSLVNGLIIDEGLDLGDVELTRWVFNVLVECGCDIADIVG